MRKVCITITVLFLLSVFSPSPSYGWMVLNNTECAFEGQCGGGENLAVIRADIVSGAAYYLESHANILMFLNRIERSNLNLNSLDFRELSSLLESATEQMEKARAAYFNLFSTASETAYDLNVSEQLKGFNYIRFGKERGLTPSIFKKAAAYLKKGDVRGVYDKFYQDVEFLVIQLYEIKTVIDQGNLPGFPQLYRLNQAVSEVQLFGQYVTEVINQIKK